MKKHQLVLRFLQTMYFLALVLGLVPSKKYFWLQHLAEQISNFVRHLYS